MLDSVIERLAAPDSASISIRTMPRLSGHANLLQPAISSTRSWMSKPTGAGRNSKSPSIRPAGSLLHTASSASLTHSPKPIKPAHAAISRSSQQWPFTAHGNHPENTPRPTGRRSSALKPNSKRSSRYQATPSEKKALNFIPSLSSPSPKNTGGVRTRITNSDLKRIEGWLLGVTTTLARAICLKEGPRLTQDPGRAPSLPCREAA